MERKIHSTIWKRFMRYYHELEITRIEEMMQINTYILWSLKCVIEKCYYIDQTLFSVGYLGFFRNRWALTWLNLWPISIFKHIESHDSMVQCSLFFLFVFFLLCVWVDKLSIDENHFDEARNNIYDVSLGLFYCASRSPLFCSLFLLQATFWFMLCLCVFFILSVKNLCCPVSYICCMHVISFFLVYLFSCCCVFFFWSV